MEELKSYADIAKAARVSAVSVGFICKGERAPSRKMAEDLEFATGIPREAWMWPDRWYNPYVATSKRTLPDIYEIRKIYTMARGGQGVQREDMGTKKGV
jgi:hypothetical protein